MRVIKVAPRRGVTVIGASSVRGAFMTFEVSWRGHLKEAVMKKFFALAVAVTFALFLPTIAAAKEGHKSSTPHFSGTITSWDDNAKQGSVKDSAGKEHSFGWNEKTTLSGTPKVGEHASIKYSKDKDGKIWATHVSFGEKPASTKPPKSGY